MLIIEIHIIKCIQFHINFQKVDEPLPESKPVVEEPAQGEEKTRIPVDISIDSDKDEEDLFAGITHFKFSKYCQICNNI